MLLPLVQQMSRIHRRDHGRKVLMPLVVVMRRVGSVHDRYGTLPSLSANLPCNQSP
jgi:hypothetical protein